MVRRIIDVSAGISSGMSVYPGDPRPLIRNIFSVEEHGFSVSELVFGTHSGTHIDAPSHVIKGGKTIDEISPEHFSGRAVVLDMSHIESFVSCHELEACFQSSGAADDPSIDIVLIRISNSYSDMHGDSSGRGLDGSAGKWFIEHGFKTIGVDALSVDSDPALPNHRLLLQNDICIVENLDLSRVKEGIYDFVCLPLKIVGCDAAPARALLFEI